MTLPEEGYLLRVFIGESDRHGGMLLYEWIVRTARDFVKEWPKSPRTRLPKKLVY